MALFHRATVTPTKTELLVDWVPTQPWGPSAGDSLEVIGAFRFDDPQGSVGMETHLVAGGDAIYQVPLTYRDAPVDGAEASLITEMEHSALGTRWIYDGLADPDFVTVLAGVALTGQGEALGMVVYDGRWHIAPSNVRIRGGGWSLERVPVDGFTLSAADSTAPRLENDRFAMTVFRRPEPGPQPAPGLTATWDDRPPVVLADIHER